jgi:hypothetical protein
MAAGFPSLDFQDFHKSELPRRLAAGNGAIAAKDALERLGSLAFRLPEGDAFTYVGRADGVDVVEGDEAAKTVIEISRQDWENVVHELESAPGLLYGGKVKCLRGNAMRFVRWEPGLRAMFQGRPIFDPQDVDLRDRNGRPLDPRQSFRPGDDEAEMAHFLKTAGYLLVRSVFSNDEVEAFRAQAVRLKAMAVEGDKKSWWGRNAGGEEVLCRVTHAGRLPELQGLPRDPRLRQLASLSDVELMVRARWHRDCGMGGHAAMCPVLIFSIYLQPSRPETGELKMLPGSHEASYGFADPSDPDAPAGVSVAADPGDVSLHYGDIMHAAPPPTGTGPFRECLLTAYARPEAYNHRGGHSYNDVLLSREDGQVEHLQKVVDRT